MIRSWLRSLANVFRRDEINARLDEEVQYHIDMHARRAVVAGMSLEDARREALVRFGGRDLWKEEARDAWRSRLLDEIARDLRFSLRAIKRHPGFATAVALTMALGIAATASIFSIADAFLFRPLPVPDGNRIVMIGDIQGEDQWLPASYLEFTDLRTMSRDASDIVAFFSSGFTYAGSDIVDRIRVGRVSRGYLDFVGAKLILGRLFVPDDHRESAAPVVVLDEMFWKTQLGARPDVVGQSLSLNGSSYTIAGVAHAMLEIGRRAPAAWIPLEHAPPWRDRGTHYLTVLAKVRDGATVQSLARDLDGAARRMREANNTTHGFVLAPLRDRLVGGDAGRGALVMVLASVGLLLVIAIANVAGLLQARTASRAGELGVRLTLGASRGRLVRQVTTEAMVLALFGCGLGLAFTHWIMRGLVWLWPPGIPRPFEIGMHPRVVTLAILLSFLGAIVAAALTSIARRGPLSVHFRSSSGATATHRVRRGLVVTQVAVTMMLLIAAGLTMRSLMLLLQRPIGFDTHQVLTASVSVPQSRYDPAGTRTFYRNLLDRVRTLPGVKDAGAVANLPLSGGGMNGDLEIEGREFPPGEAPIAEKMIVTPGYFQAMQIRLVRGRLFDERDHGNAPRSAIINEAMAKELWPDADPIGARIRSLSDSTQWENVVGIVSDVRMYELESEVDHMTYVPFDQFPSRGMSLVIRGLAAEVQTSALRAAVRAIDREVPVFGIQPYERVVFLASHNRRVPAVLLGAFATLALALAAIGLYGLLSYSVTQRRHEMGVRMAVGARSSDLMRLVFGDGMRLVAAGALFGMVAAAALARLIASLLYGIGPRDPLVYGFALVTVVLVALLACVLPARRASGLHPSTALRAE